MANYTLEKVFQSDTTMSPNVMAVANMFGLGGRTDKPVKVVDSFEISVRPGEVVYITGGSGAGKSVLLRMLKERMAGAIDLSTEPIPQAKPLIDCFDEGLQESLSWLSMAGLSDAFAILRNPEQLSDGQRYRFRLALALSRRPKVICIDEFCAALDRVTAAVIAHNVRRYADRFGTTFIVATSHDDLLEDLCPDVVVVKHLGSGCDVYYPGRAKEQAEAG